MKQQGTLTRQAIRTPRAAAVAGIIFAVLITISLVLIRLAIPEELSGSNTAAWLQGNTTTLTLALTLVPFAGIAAAGEQRRHILVGSCLSGMGVCD